MPCTCDGRFIIVDRKVAAALAVATGLRQLSVDERGDRTNQFGGKRIIKFNPSTAETNSGIKPSDTLFAWSSPDGEPRAVSVDVGRISQSGGWTFPLASDPVSGLPLSYRARAEVTVGTPGTIFDPFFVDINRGQRFTLAASYVAVTAMMLAPPTLADGTIYASGSMCVAAGIGMAPAVSVAPPFYTMYIDGLDDGGVADVVVPPRANILWAVRSSIPGNAIQLTQMDNAGTTIDDPGAFVNGAMVQPIGLASDIYQIRVTNTGASGVFANIRLVFRISA